MTHEAEEQRSGADALPTSSSTRLRRPELLGVYLNDHLMGASGGVELAHRLASTFERAADRDTLSQMAKEIEEDRQSLMDLMARLAVPKNRPKMLAGWVGEKLGRLKPNGSLFHRTPLTGVVELEAMHLGVEGKEAGWRLLRELADHDTRLEPQKLDRLIDRAVHQKQVLDELRRQTAVAVFGQS